ncbi:CopD family protein [Asticcacaulis excentricus]|uniref:Protoporphyrinogen IX oxidase n=1 Tax=Asticcacaulis excentricus TaxID=78587 RepID=A0A3G9G7J7_9CAUL|nr:CopD family protein [Asticcacaulis excentricus]BBF81153.1 protoporphyrinogen IX oxidase, novel form, HemJ [Asticcacaulis excentricus]
MNHYDLLRGLHILAVIAWMAGLLYLPRLFINHIANRDKPQVVEVLSGMERRLLRFIMNPAMIVAWLFGAGLIYSNVHDRFGWKFFYEPWFVVKMIGIVLITGYHHFLAVRLKKLHRGEDIGSEKFWRIANEIPAIIAIVMVIAVTTEMFTI